jgi:hypothetical protein
MQLKKILAVTQMCVTKSYKLIKTTHVIFESAPIIYDFDKFGKYLKMYI